MKKSKKIIGLIGGMGPFAGVEFCRLILEKSSKDFGAKDGEDFPEIVLDSVPVPDFISDTRRLPEAKTMLISRIKKLNKFGCTSIAMVCNTGHILFPELSKVSNVKMISLINAVRDEVIKSGIKRVGLLSTRTTVKSNLYKKAFSYSGISIVIPDPETIDVCEKIMRGVIANNNSNVEIKKMTLLTEEFIKKENLDGIILGCTELPLAFPKNKFSNVFDCLGILSNKILSDYFIKEDKSSFF